MMGPRSWKPCATDRVARERSLTRAQKKREKASSTPPPRAAPSQVRTRKLLWTAPPGSCPRGARTGPRFVDVESDGGVQAARAKAKASCPFADSAGVGSPVPTAGFVASGATLPRVVSGTCAPSARRHSAWTSSLSSSSSVTRTPAPHETAGLGVRADLGWGDPEVAPRARERGQPGCRPLTAHARLGSGRGGGSSAASTSSRWGPRSPTAARGRSARSTRGFGWRPARCARALRAAARRFGRW
jgi:hypothetical protein